jgi:hypothetical protein
MGRQPYDSCAMWSGSLEFSPRVWVAALAPKTAIYRRWQSTGDGNLRFALLFAFCLFSPIYQYP